MKMGGDSVMARDVKNKTMILFLPNCRPKINAVGGAPLKMAKNIFPPNHQLSGLVDIGLIRIYTKLERKNDQKLTSSFRNHQTFGLLGKITSRGELSRNFSMSNYS
jgi:hypothetical protein